MHLVDGALLFSLLLILFAPRFEAVRSIADAADFHAAAVDLNNSNFDRVLMESPANFVIVEFFAHWCPACRNYKPHYEKVARLFNGPDAVHPGIILMVQVDCAMKMNANLCDRFSVGYYPMLLWGPPVKFAAGKWSPKQENNDIQSIDDARTADQLLEWINKKMGSSFNFDDDRYENETSLSNNATDPELIARAIYDVEEATALAFEIIIQHKMIKSRTHASLIKFLQLLVTHHPSKRCRRGIAEILVSFDDLWPSGSISVGSKEGPTLQEQDIIKSYPICGKEVPRHYWIFCRGSKNETRGYRYLQLYISDYLATLCFRCSCGLWVLFHSLSVRVRDGESQFVFMAICDFIQNLFICDDCRRHFREMSSSVSAPFNTTRDLSIWLWKAHNNVNERLMKEENDLGTGDPRFPKVVWPPQQLCPSCYSSPSRKSSTNMKITWDEDEVFKFLVRYYGRTLVSSQKDASLSTNKDAESFDTTPLTNTVTLPFGAALGIALGSCTFAALACFWRTRQKSSKYSHHHSFKNI